MEVHRGAFLVILTYEEVSDGVWSIGENSLLSFMTHWELVLILLTREFPQLIGEILFFITLEGVVLVPWTCRGVLYKRTHQGFG